MKSEHKKIQKWVKSKYSKKFDVCAEAIDGKNRLPNKEKHVYQPDVVLKRKKSGDIAYIIEVENDPVRKALVGASILADCSVRFFQKTKPILIFVIYSKDGIKAISNFEEKLKIAKEYCPKLKDICVYCINDFKKKLL